MAEPTVQKLSQGKRPVRDNHWKQVALGVGADGATVKKHVEFIGCVLGSGEFSYEEFLKWQAFAEKEGRKLTTQVGEEESLNLSVLLFLAARTGKLFLLHQLLVEAFAAIVKSLHLEEGIEVYNAAFDAKSTLLDEKRAEKTLNAAKANS